MPHSRRVDGTVATTKPLNYGGRLIENFSLTFERGRVVRVEAESGAEVLEKLIATDEGAARLGEIALVPHGSPISALGRLFYNTLFDENASSHAALGQAYNGLPEWGRRHVGAAARGCGRQLQRDARRLHDRVWPHGRRRRARRRLLGTGDARRRMGHPSVVHARLTAGRRLPECGSGRRSRVDLSRRTQASLLQKLWSTAEDAEEVGDVRTR